MAGRIEVKKPDEAEVVALGARDWPIWTCGVSRFDWEYDEDETCLILEGEVTVTAGSESVSFGPGDLVRFPKGLACVWDVAKPVRKHYKFG